MADEQQELRRVSWTEVFSFTHIFKSFRMAIHPSKLLLALAAVALVTLLGWLLGWIWYAAGSRAHVEDVFFYYTAQNGKAYTEQLEKRHDTAVANLKEKRRTFLSAGSRFQPFITEYSQNGGSTSSPFFNQFQALAKDKPGESRQGALSDLDRVSAEDIESVFKQHSQSIIAMLDSAKDIVDEAEQKADDEIKHKSDREKAKTQQEKDVNAAGRAMWKVRVDQDTKVCESIHGLYIGNALAKYESQCFTQALRAFGRMSFFGGFDVLLAARQNPPSASTEYTAGDPQAGVNLLARESEKIGLFAWLAMMAWGLIWLACTHPLFAIFFLLLGLAVWAVFGGAIARIAALHAAREEKISISQSLKFSVGKFFSFFTAPLIPLAIIIFLGILLGLGGLLGALPVGDIIMGLIFVVPLIVGALIAFLTIGLVAGLPLMYPTIAVEGSDSFDAISRSFSYIFARPWRYALYSIVTVLYGAVCYLFVRFFAWLLLAATHLFVARGLFGLGAGLRGRPALAEGADKMDLMWTRPTFDQLAGPLNFPAMSWNEMVSSLLINFWVYVVVGLVIAFLLSFCVSSQTVIYYLLRRKVDATDLDDVYVEELEEVEGESVEAPAAPGAASPAEPSAPAVEERPEQTPPQ